MFPSISQAINLLRPDMANRDQIIDSILQDVGKKHKMYFSTIPRDIINIILDMVPSLRQRDFDAQIKQAVENYANFVQTYITISSTRTELNRSRIIHDFCDRHRRGYCHDNRCCVKLMTFASNDSTKNDNKYGVYLTHDPGEYFIGNNKYIHRDSHSGAILVHDITKETELSKTCTTLSHCTQWFLAVNIFLLPCKLLVTIDTMHKIYHVVDMEADSRIRCTIAGTLPNKLDRTLINDLGNFIQVSKFDKQAVMMSDLSTGVALL